MNWVVTSLIMFCASVVYYLILRVAQLRKINYRISNIANFSIPAVLYLIINVIQHKTIFLPLPMMILLFLSSFFLSYIGASVSYVALSIAPNSGYSLIIQKSYAVYTSIAAIFLFHSSLTVIKYIAILIVLVSNAFISVSQEKTAKKNNYWWVILSLVSFFCFGTLRLTNKMFVLAGISTTVLLFWTMVFVAFLSVVDYFLHKERLQLKMPKRDLIVLAGIGLSVTFFYYFLQISEVNAPNIGYVNILNTSSNAVYTILIAYLFKDKLTRKKVFAVAAATIGIILLVI